jgi:hypothetical protein
MYSFFLWRSSLYWAGTHDHTQTHHAQWDSCGRAINQSHRLLPDNTQTQKIQKSMPTVGFEAAIPASERPHTHAVNSAPTGIDTYKYHVCLYTWNKRTETSVNNYEVVIFIFDECVCVNNQENCHLFTCQWKYDSSVSSLCSCNLKS